MSEKCLTENQLKEIEKVYEEWMAEVKALEGVPEPYRHPNQLDGNLDSPYNVLKKKYMRKILEIKGKLPEEGETNG